MLGLMMRRAGARRAGIPAYSWHEGCRLDTCSWRPEGTDLQAIILCTAGHGGCTTVTITARDKPKSKKRDIHGAQKGGMQLTHVNEFVSDLIIY